MVLKLFQLKATFQSKRRCFCSVAKKNIKGKGEGGREKRGGRRRETQIVKSKIALTLV